MFSEFFKILSCTGRSLNNLTIVPLVPNVARNVGNFNVTNFSCRFLAGTRNFSSLQSSAVLSALHPTNVPMVNCLQSCRTVIKWNQYDGKRESVEEVTRRFYYLNWRGRGIWIRSNPGKYNSRWKKSWRRKNRLDNQVFCNANYSRTLDKMVTKYWRKQFHFLDDPNYDFHNRDFFDLTKRPLKVP